MTDRAEAIYRLILAYSKNEISSQPFENQIKTAEADVLRDVILHLAYWLHGYRSARNPVTVQPQPE